ncbi:MAG: SDR family NAD(P)-dependent oxidoreductase [Pirellulales bacterium]|nr:SDR family NAD(P)-dependent oxidoreductase [Pirellulales bacterium]
MARRSLRDCRVLITGASSGIGRALAIELAQRGSQVLVFARNRDRLEELVAELRRMGARAEAVAGDVTSADDRAAALRAATAGFGGLDILINNAGVGALGPFLSAEPSRLRAVMEVNLFAVAELTREAVPLLRHGSRPLVVNIGSILGQRALPRMSEYCASKFALQGLSTSLRGELRPLGIDLLLVCPGTTQTEFHSHLVDRRGDVPWPVPAGLPAEVCAGRIAQAMERGRRNLIPDWPAWWLSLLNRHLPAVVDRWMERYG